MPERHTSLSRATRLALEPAELAHFRLRLQAAGSLPERARILHELSTRLVNARPGQPGQPGARE